MQSINVYISGLDYDLPTLKKAVKDVLADFNDELLDECDCFSFSQIEVNGELKGFDIHIYQEEETDPLSLIYYPCVLDSADNWQTGDYSSCFIVYLADKKLPKGDFTIEVYSGDLCHKQVKYLGSI